MKTYKIKVTRADIKKGKPMSPFCCPIANAINRTLGDLACVSGARVRFRSGDKYVLLDPTNRVRDFMCDFDAGREVKPTTFTLKEGTMTYNTLEDMYGVEFENLDREVVKKFKVTVHGAFPKGSPFPPFKKSLEMKDAFTDHELTADGALEECAYYLDSTGWDIPIDLYKEMQVEALRQWPGGCDEGEIIFVTLEVG